MKDIYNEGRILKDGMVPREMVYSCKHFRRQMVGLQVPRNVYVAVCGTDLIRLERWRVCGAGGQSAGALGGELYADQPAGDEADVSAVVSQLQRAADRAVPQLLLGTLRSLAPEGRPEPNIVLLSPGVFNSAYFEHAYLARQMGIELVEGRDLVAHDNIVYMRTTAGCGGWT